MHSFDLLAERKIEEALARGEFENLPGAGKPIRLDEDPLVPEGVRMAYRILKNSGYLPPEVESLKEIAALEEAVLGQGCADDASRARAVRRLSLLKTRIESAYYDRVLARIGSVKEGKR